MNANIKTLFLHLKMAGLKAASNYELYQTFVIDYPEHYMSGARNILLV